MEERFRLCTDSIDKLLNWLTDVEQKLAGQDAMKEDSNKLRNQINNLKVCLADFSKFSFLVFGNISIV